MNNQRGFAIVGTVLVLCVVIVLVASATALRLANQMRQGTDARQWDDARLLAESCAETALQRLRADAAYAGNETVAVGTGSCSIRPLLLDAGATIIQTEAAVSGHPYRIEIELDDVESVHVSSWKHVTAF